MSTAEQSRLYRLRHPVKSERELQQRRKAEKRYRLAHPDRVRNSRRRYEQKNKDKINARNRAKYHRDPVRAAFRSRVRKYGITLEEFQLKLQFQKGLCSICCKPLLKPQQDHDHSSGKNRDLLCMDCNLILGHAHDQILVLKAAISYLKRHQMATKKHHKFSHSHITHHKDGSATVHHVHEDGAEHDVHAAVGNHDSLMDHIMDHTSPMNEGEAEADAGQHGVPAQVAGPAGLPMPAGSMGA